MARPLSAIVLGVFILFAIPVSGANRDKWVEVRSPNFIVVSNAGEKQARKTAIRFEQIRAVFRRSIAVASSHPSPLITILAVKDEDSMRSLLPEYWAKGHSHPPESSWRTLTSTSRWYSSMRPVPTPITRFITSITTR